ncbi:filamentous hemagglutinin N-terminal domain-containing protein [Parapusillimonas sp. SGNA-6]|nr:filamentous hemagglutinin N-terminal domain-containing protein [Parapusillimonas sp. SGNA-6]
MTQRNASRSGARTANMALRRARHRNGPAFYAPPAFHAPPALCVLATLIVAIVSGAAQAQPSGGAVVAGQATIQHGVGAVDINQASDKAIINWDKFGIKSGEAVNFRQPGSQSVTLNRVIGHDPSAIHGALTANGTVMLVNPNGIVFGHGARVDVGGLVATTANIRDDDFLAGRYRFDQASDKLNARVINEGHISIKDNGLAALVAPSVQNTGVIQARLGKVALAGAQRFTLDFHGDGLLSFDAGSAVDAIPRDADGQPMALVDNAGQIHAEGGTVLLSANAVKTVVDKVINTSGVVSATSVDSHQGNIVLSGGQAGTVAVDGKLDASGVEAGQQGGKIVITGQHVAVNGTASLDVSGATAGGEIALGSLGIAPDHGAPAFSGKSSTVTVASGAQLKADALHVGKGGTITLWSEDATVHAGAISARGGQEGGDGGFAEVSSNKKIGLTGSADLRAPKGKTGLLLIDPETLTITDDDEGVGDQDVAAGSGTLGPDAPNIGGNTISRGLLESLTATTNIKLEATGQITVNAMTNDLIDLQTTSGHYFWLQSTETGGIKFDDPDTVIRTAGGDITLTALGSGSLENIGGLESQGGTITLSATNGNIILRNTIDADDGKVGLHATNGSITNHGVGYRVAGLEVDLLAANGIGGASSRINTDALSVSAEVTGDGDIYLGSSHEIGVGLQQVTTANGNIDIAASGGLISYVGLSAGNGGHITLRAETSGVYIDHDLTLADGGNLTIDARGEVYVNGTIALIGADDPGGGGTVGANLDVTAKEVTLLGTVMTDGAQAYHADATVLFDSLAAGGSMTFDGDVVVWSDCSCPKLDAVDTTVLASDESILIGGGLYGEENGEIAVSMTAAKNVTIRDEVRELDSLDITADTIKLGSVSTNTKQFYSGQTTLSGEYVVNDGIFLVDGTATLAGDTTIEAYSGIGFNGRVEGRYDLAIHAGEGYSAIAFADMIGSADTRLGALTTSAEATYFNGAVHADSVTASGAIALAGNRVDTTGAQTYGGHVTLAGDTTLSGSLVTFAQGTDSGINAGQHALTIQGDASLSGDLGAQNALASLTVLGSTTLGQGSITTVGQQTYQGTLTALSEEGITLTAARFTFDGDVSASKGAIALTNDATGTVTFSNNATVHAAKGFTQQGGGTLHMPASLRVDQGPISITALASLPAGKASITTDGTITIAGLRGPDTRLTMASGGGAQNVGLDNSDARYKIDVAQLIVPDAGSANLYGTVAAHTGAQAAEHITTDLTGHPYYINNTPWQPAGSKPTPSEPATRDTVNRIAAITAPQIIVPSTPRTDSLFRRTVTPEGVGADALALYADPRVLTLADDDSDD